MEEDSATNIIKLEAWMTDLPRRLREIPFIYLAIPGSHDSMSYGITRSSGLAPDAEPILHKLYPLFRGTVLRWTVTQGVDTLRQLLIGIRYFDLRLATKTGENHFYFTHGLYAEEITGALIAVKKFIEEHPGEMVILDFQHFYGFTSHDHKRLIEVLLYLYGDRIVSRELSIPELTLNNLNNFGKQIVIIYRHESVNSVNLFWTSRMFPTPWPQVDDTIGLISYLRNVHRGPETGFVHQAVLTPTPTFIAFRWYSSLLKKCAEPVNKKVLPLLTEFSPGPPVGNHTGALAPINVVISDFVEINNAEFSKTIIYLNLKLLRIQSPTHSVN